jgi:hypothetical protein
MLALFLCSMAMMAASPVDAILDATVGVAANIEIGAEPNPAADAASAADLPALASLDLDAAGSAAAVPAGEAAAPASQLASLDLGGTTAPAAATPLLSLVGAPAQELGDDVLADQRGGFEIGGVDVTLGAQIETYIDGQLSLVTTVNWTHDSATTTQNVMGLLTPATAAQLQNGLLNTGQINMKVGDASVFLANGGQTAVVQNTASGIQSLVINTANNTDIRTQVDATINLDGYSGFRDNFLTGTIAASLGQAIGAATMGAVRN